MQQELYAKSLTTYIPFMSISELTAILPSGSIMQNSRSSFLATPISVNIFKKTL